MRRSCLSVAIFVLLLGGCGKPEPAVVNRLQDARRPAVLTFVSPKEARRVEVRVHGQLEGTAALWATNFAPLKLTGKFDRRSGGAWPGGAYAVHYAPVNVRTGAITVEVRFRP